MVLAPTILESENTESRAQSIPKVASIRITCILWGGYMKEWRVGDKCRVMGFPATIFLRDKAGYHVRYWGDEDIELPHRVFQENELGQL
jgi:hypothetical protein